MKISCCRRRLLLAVLSFAWFANAARGGASVVGANLPAQSLTRERVKQLPAVEQAKWLAYLDRSEELRKADKDTFAAELKSANVTTAIEPPHGYGANSVPLNREQGWYAGAEAAHIADVIVSFQTPAGGWGKNLDMSKEARQAGAMYGPNNVSNFLAPGDFDTPSDREWEYIGTIDNDATTTQLKFLAKVIAEAGRTQNAARYRASFKRGMEYLLAAQYPNGGWPQVWPLEGGYHDAITYNDNAMTQVLALLSEVARGTGEFAFAPEEMRQRARTSFERGLSCILDTQIASGGSSTVWAQQDDPLTLKPVSARNFEMPALSSGESAGILIFLMDLEHPSAAQERAVYAGIAWLRKTAIYGQSWQQTPDGRGLVAKQGVGPIWARFYEMSTNKPIFGDRDKSIHDDVKEISKERRNGYAWYSDGPQRALDRFATWSLKHPESR
jgi:PelA/Pel-15E family pectate lyase